MKKTIGILVIILLFIGSFFGVFYAIKYNSVKDKEANIKNYEEQIENWEKKYDALNTQLGDLTINFNETLEQLEISQSTNEENLKIIEEYKSQINELQSSLETTQSSLTEALESIDEKNSLIKDYIASITNFQKQLEILNQTITTLNSIITYYEELLEAYDFTNKAVVTFKLFDEVYKVAVVDTGSTLKDIVEEPYIAGYKFTGWSIDGDNPIDENEYIYTQNTTLIALMTTQTEKIDVVSQVNQKTSETTYNESHFISSIVINGNNIISVDFEYVNGIKFLNIDANLIDFTTVQNNTIFVEIPMSYIEENYPNEVPNVYSSIYFKAVYKVVDNSFKLVDYYKSSKATQPDYGSQIEIKKTEQISINQDYTIGSFDLVRTNMQGAETYRGHLSFEDSNLTITINQNKLIFEKSEIGIYSINTELEDTNIFICLYINNEHAPIILDFDKLNLGRLTVQEV